MEQGFPVEIFRYEQLKALFVHWKAGYSMRIWWRICLYRHSGETYVIFAALQWFLARLGGTYRISNQWESTEPTLKFAWWHFMLSHNSCILPNFMFIGWNLYECLKKYQKMISRSLIVLNFIKLCGIMRDFPNYVEKMKLCDSASAHNSVGPAYGAIHVDTSIKLILIFIFLHWCPKDEARQQIRRMGGIIQVMFVVWSFQEGN